MYCFGIDVGGTTVKCGLFQTDGTLVEKWEIPTRKENKGEYILPDVAETIQNKISEKGIDKAEVAGVGVGIPGPINAQGEAACAVNLYWGFRPVAKELSELTGLTAKAGNDANVAALGEAWKGAAAGSQNVIMVTLGTGVGGGIISDGRIVAGAHGAGGEIGHANICHEETAACNCGNSGCLEQYASATGIARLARIRLAKNNDMTLLRGQEITAKAVFDALKEGDKVAEEIVEEFGAYLGYALADVAAVIDPSMFIIGGGVSKAGPIIIQYVKKYFLEKAFFANEGTEFIIAVLGNDAGMCGAAKLILG